jgi:hypothetical protein
MAAQLLFEPSWERMFQALENVRLCRERAVAALNATGIPYTVIGGQAVAYWVETKDDGAVRGTPNSDFLIRDADFDAARSAFESAGFVHRPEAFRGAFGDGPDGKPRNGVRLWIADERVRTDDLLPLPDVSERINGPRFPVITLEALLRMLLVRDRNVDGMYLRDLLGVGLFDWSWPDRYPPPLDERLRHVLNTPDG